MKLSKKWIIVRRIASATKALLLVLLIGFLVLPILTNYPDQLNQAGQQSTRSQRIAKDVYVLSYRPMSEHAQAINELQNILPAWEKEQTYLQSLHFRDDMRLLIVQSQADYLAVDTAGRNVLVESGNNQRPDPNQVQIVVDHERSYFLLMSQFMTLAVQHMEESFVTVVILQMILSGVILLLVIIQHFLAEYVQSLALTYKERMVRHYGNCPQEESQ